MKKFSLFITLLSLMLSLVGCKSSDAVVNSADVTSTSSSAVTESVEETTNISVSESNENTSDVETQTSKDESTVDKSTSKNNSNQSSAENKTQKNSSTSTKKPTETSKPTVSSKPKESSKATEPPKPKSAFAKPFDTGTMKSELIAYGKSIGMTHITNFDEDFGGGKITPDGTTWLPPHETWMYDSSSASKLKQDLCDRIKRWKNEGEKTFTLWFEKDSNHSGDYIIYVIIA